MGEICSRSLKSVSRYKYGSSGFGKWIQRNPRFDWRRKGEFFSPRIKRLNREAVCCVMLRRKGFSYTYIAAVLGRSTSFVYRIIAGRFHRDLRKLPRLQREICAFWDRARLMKFRAKWAEWVGGEGERPP